MGGVCEDVCCIFEGSCKRWREGCSMNRRNHGGSEMGIVGSYSGITEGNA